MTLQEYFHKAQRELSDLQTFLDVQIGSGAIVFINNRIRHKGEKAEGGQFKPYSTKPSLIGATSFTSKTYADKVFGKGTKNRSLEWVTYKGHKLAVMPGGYKQIREIETRQTNHKDYERTNHLWPSIHVIGTNEIGPGRFQTRVGSEDPRSITIMESVKDREGTDFLALSKSEEKELERVLAEKLIKIFQ